MALFVDADAAAAAVDGAGGGDGGDDAGNMAHAQTWHLHSFHCTLSLSPILSPFFFPTRPSCINWRPLACK